MATIQFSKRRYRQVNSDSQESIVVGRRRDLTPYRRLVVTLDCPPLNYEEKCYDELIACARGH